MNQYKKETVINSINDKNNGIYNSNINNSINYNKNGNLQFNSRSDTDFEINISEEHQELLMLQEDNSVTTLQNLVIEEKPIKKGRKYWVDALRILASYMVVLVHCSSYAIYEVEIFTGPWYGLMFWDAMSRSCVPLFIMISGILFLDPNKEIPTSKLYKKYIYRIFKNLVFWNIFYGTVVKYLINPFNYEYTWGFHNITEFIGDLLYGKFHLWYLYMCIGLYAVTPLMRSFSNDEEILKYFLALGLILVQIIPFISTVFKDFLPILYFKEVGEVLGKLMIFLVYGYTIYYALGYYLSQLEIKRQATFFVIYIIGFFSLFMTYFFKIILSLRLKEEYVNYGDYNSFNVCVTSICIFIFFKYNVNEFLNKLLRNPTFKKVLLTLSDLSFGVYLIHILYFDIFRVIGFNSYSFNPFICSPIHALCIWICGAITVYIMKKIPILKNFV
ncbi:hypothetical protein H8356DRAFT_476953 [Neocallimastix lanati (nom. inval.)]|nr:hypothetical protein H8356DRAFT_476953 [Neocallimastix sp. JGI-2020a]